ncbi:MAG: hypothetical protein V3581_04015 [Candidatus Cardinium sp.]
MKPFINGLLDLLFPSICVVCNHKLVQGEILICTICFSPFPETDAHKLVDNAIVVNYFLDKTTIAYGFALYRLIKKSRLEQVIFAMKYNNQPKIRKLLGEYYRNILNQVKPTKNKIERTTNLQGAFTVTQPALLAGKHLLLVDGMLTIGATLTSYTNARSRCSSGKYCNHSCSRRIKQV